MAAPVLALAELLLEADVAGLVAEEAGLELEAAAPDEAGLVEEPDPEVTVEKR
jgi:hypothetical protein